MIPQASSRGRERARLAKPARSRQCAKAAAVTREVCRRCELFRASRQASPLALSPDDDADVPSKGAGPASTAKNARCWVERESARVFTARKFLNEAAADAAVGDVGQGRACRSRHKALLAPVPSRSAARSAP